ncbi:hypothetical protein DENSPDRAFT_838272 [Dentipellis sp. KUC8613]|nr:hypothetical protein DENSPDRAFT_838272 [Dentipellis sp. KUC8613]
MNPQVRTGPARLNSYHGPKRQLLGPHAGQAAPAWRASNIPTGPALANGAASSSKKSITQGSKILLSNLPMDVGESEVEELFKRTVGPMKDLFVIYNSQGKSKGMAIVTFHRPGDAAIARSKYNHKIVDGRHKLKIEVVTDSDGVVSPAAPAKQANPPSLLARIGKPVDVTPKQPKLPHIAAAPIAAAPAPAYVPFDLHEIRSSKTLSMPPVNPDLSCLTKQMTLR